VLPFDRLFQRSDDVVEGFFMASSSAFHSGGFTPSR
jgi:hypothetical protein